MKRVKRWYLNPNRYCLTELTLKEDPSGARRSSNETNLLQTADFAFKIMYLKRFQNVLDNFISTVPPWPRFYYYFTLPNEFLQHVCGCECVASLHFTSCVLTLNVLRIVCASWSMCTVRLNKQMCKRLVGSLTD